MIWSFFLFYLPDVVYLPNDVAIRSNAIWILPGATKQCKFVVSKSDISVCIVQKQYLLKLCNSLYQLLCQVWIASHPTIYIYMF